MQLKFLCIPIFIMSFVLRAMEEREKEVKTVADISWHSAELAKKLSEQPLFDGEGSVHKECKVLPLKSWGDANICSILSDNAERILGKKNAWCIHDFGCGNNQLYDAGGEVLGNGIALWLYSNNTMCSLECLERTYKNIITLLQIDWKSAQLEDHPVMMHKKDPEQWHLFVKKNNLIGEDVLIRFLASKFNMTNMILCHGEWLKTPKLGYEYRDEIYLWVKKDAKEKFDEIFGFHE
jgi:hypothetical protein